MRWKRAAYPGLPGPSWTGTKVGLGVLAFVRVDAERNSGEATRVLEEAIRQMPEVTSCHYISGCRDV